MTTARKWTAEQDAYILQHYVLAGAEQLARILGQPAYAITCRAIKLGLSKTARMDAAVLALASRPEGMRATELGHGAQVSRSLRTLRNATPPLIRVIVAHKHVRYFVRQEDADAALAERVRPANVTIHNSGKRKGWGPNDPPFIDPAHPPKITVAPPPKPCLRTNTHSPMG